MKALRWLASGILLVILAAEITGQTTRIQPALQAIGTAIANGALWVTLPTGSISQADLGPGLLLDTSSGPRPMVRLAPTPTPPPTITMIVNEQLVSDALQPGLVYRLAQSPIAGTLAVYRNGLRQREGPGNDYTRAGLVITFNAVYAADPGAIVTADYQPVPPE